MTCTFDHLVGTQTINDESPIFPKFNKAVYTWHAEKIVFASDGLL